MVWQGTQSPSRFTRGSLLSWCLFVVLTAAANNAWGSCGDYLHGHGTKMMGHHAAGHHEMNADALSTILGNRDTLPSRPACSGPHCQRDQQTPAAPSKAIQVPTFTDAILAAITTLVREDDQYSVPSSKANQVRGLVGRVFRPPRAA